MVNSKKLSATVTTDHMTLTHWQGHPSRLYSIQQFLLRPMSCIWYSDLPQALPKGLTSEKSVDTHSSLIFCIQSQVSFKDKTAYHNVSVSGDIFIQNQLKVLIKVSCVDFQQDDSQGNPVLAYLQHHGTAQGLTTPLTKCYSLNTPDVSTTFNAPLTNKPYSKISTPFMLTLTSLILHLSLLLSLTECGQALQPTAMLKLL